MGGRSEAAAPGLPTDAGLDKWSTDEDDGAIDPGSWGDGDTKPATPLLDTIEYPVHLKHLKLPQLRQLCKEIRADLIHTVSKVGCLPRDCWLPLCWHRHARLYLRSTQWQRSCVDRGAVVYTGYHSCRCPPAVCYCRTFVVTRQ